VRTSRTWSNSKTAAFRVEELNGNARHRARDRPIISKHERDLMAHTEV